MHGKRVAPLVGAWIEIQGLRDPRIKVVVAPLVGAWIEIRHYLRQATRTSRRSPRGSVD